jgi:multidrug efflux system membrane fusion protein
MKRTLVAILILSGLVGAGVAVWFYTLPKQNEFDTRSANGRTDRVYQVKVAPVSTASIPFILDAVGTVEAEQSVAVRSEVSGVLQKIAFKEGDLVKAGQLLFQIDADSQKAEVEKANANLARDQAALVEANAQAKRLESLVAKEYVTQQEYAQAVAQEQAAQAAVRADHATLQTMQLQFDHAHITAPLSGRAGMLNVKQGNLVSAASTTPLVVINATQALMVAFSVPQQQLQSVRDGQRKKPLDVEVRRDAKDALLARGALAFIDNSVDTQTGTIRMKARIPNKDEIIWPGELVSLRLVLGVQQDALVVPETAVQPSQSGSFVFVLDEGKALQQAITISRQLGTQVVVAEGLKAGQQVILNPPKSLRSDMSVEVFDASKAGEGKERKRGKRKEAADAAAGSTTP